MEILPEVGLPELGMMPGTGETLTRRPRRNHSLAFKAKGALAAMKGEKTLTELAAGSLPEYERVLFWRMANRHQRAVGRGDWKYLKVADKEFLFDPGYDARERTSSADKQPDILASLCSE